MLLRCSSLWVELQRFLVAERGLRSRNGSGQIEEEDEEALEEKKAVQKPSQRRVSRQLCMGNACVFVGDASQAEGRKTGNALPYVDFACALCVRVLEAAMEIGNDASV